MTEKNDSGGFPAEASVKLVSDTKVTGTMTAEGANESEKIKSSGIRWFLILLGISAVLMGAALLLKSYAPDGVYQPKPLELQQHDSLASSHTISEKLPSSRSE